MLNQLRSVDKGRLKEIGRFENGSKDTELNDRKSGRTYEKSPSEDGLFVCWN